jgi:formylmethanofuran dehydrogenase subunit E
MTGRLSAMNSESGVMRTWAWTALHRTTGCQFGRFRTELEAREEARRRAKDRNAYRACQANITLGERLISEGQCDRCQERRPEVDGLVLLAGDTILCERCSIGERRVTLHPVLA